LKKTQRGIRIFFFAVQARGNKHPHLVKDKGRSQKNGADKGRFDVNEKHLGQVGENEAIPFRKMLFQGWARTVNSFSENA
jgi:hypothetical protein